MYELYSRGATLAEVGDAFGLSRERVRQLLVESGVRTRGTGETLALQRSRELSESRGKVCSAFDEMRDTRRVSKHLGIPHAVVKAIVKDHFPPRTRRNKRVKKLYSEEELLGFLKKASQELGGVLTTAAYNRFAKGRRSRGRHWPTNQVYYQRFGSWRSALQTAGLAANRSSPIAGKRLFDESHCLDALRAAAREFGGAPTVAQYDTFARASHGGLPSAATVRNRCGRWNDALAKAGL
jgi:hypothetical protein